MNVTALGGAMVPLCVLCCLSPTGLLCLVQIGSIFGAAAALILGGAGLQPALLPAGMFVGYVILQALLGARMPMVPQLLRVLAPLLWLGAYALAGAVTLPLVFDGAFEVWAQKPEPPVNLPTILHPGPANVTQTLYLMIDLALLVAAAIYLAPRPQALARLLTAYLLCGYAVVGFCLWQLASKLIGLPFPEAVLYSNPGWTILSDQALDGVPRISGSFSEPASLSFALCGLFYACAWMLLRGHRHKLAWPLLPLTLLCLALSTSTTGFAVLALGIFIGAVYGWLVARSAVVRVLRAALPVLGVLLIAGAVIATELPGVTASATIVAAETLAKSDTESYSERTREDLDSLELFFASYGLGVGWGSNRSSSLVPGLMSALGVPGLVLPLRFVWRLRQLSRAGRACRRPSMVVDGFAAATLGSLLTAVVSAPIIVSAMFYLNLAALIAGLLQARHGRGLALAACMMMFAGVADASEANFIDGVGTHFVQAPQTLEQGLAALRAGGFGSMRDEMYWSDIETRPGVFSFPPRWREMVEQTAAAGVRPLLVLDYGSPFYDDGDKPRSRPAIAAFARYAATVAAQFRPQAPTYEIWNEWNGSLGNTSFGVMADYLPLLRAAAAAVKRADPKAIVLADGILWSDGQKGVIEEAIRRGALAAVDGIALHPYFYNRGTDHRPEAWAAYLQATEQRMQAANAGESVPLYVTEIGWPTAPGADTVSEALQAAYAVRVFVLARTMDFVRGLWWYDLREDGKEAGFGLVRADFSAKPAFPALSAWLARLAGARYVGPVDLASPLTGLVFADRDGRMFRAVWCADDQTRVAHFGRRDVTVTSMPVLISDDAP